MLPSLFRLDESFQPQPDLAEWPDPTDISFDPFSVTLRLRQGSWSDGEPIGAEDVRFSFEQLREGPTGHRYRFLQEVEVLGERSLRLVFDRPVRRWWSLFSIDDMVLPAHAYGEEWLTGPTVSGGPYSVDGWTIGLEIRLRRNASYWGPPPLLAGIDVQFVPDDETRFQLLERGELDAFFSEGESNVGRRAEARGIDVTDGELEGGGASGAFGPTWWELELDASRLGGGVAQAVQKALDPVLVAEMLEDSGRPMDGIPPRFPVGEGSAQPWAGRGDLEEARELLGATGATFRLAYPRKGAGAAIARFAHFRLRELGVRIEIAGLQPDSFDVSQSGPDRAPAVLRLRRGADAPDAGDYGEIDDLVAAQTAVSPERLQGGAVAGLDPGAWLRAQRGMADEASVVPLSQVRSWLVGGGGLWGPRALGTAAGPLWNLHAWHVEERLGAS